MLFIKKNNEPSSLTEYKKQSNAYYDGCNKNDIRKALLKEQGYLCAYCMQRISESNMKIEHYNAQANCIEKTLDYNNMFGVCTGNENSRNKKNTTCDTHRGNVELTINPLSKASIDLICYNEDGRIYSKDPYINEDLNKTLNLNCEASLLKTNRKMALRAVKNILIKKKQKGTWDKVFLEKIKKRYETVNSEGKLEPYCGIILYYLNKKIGK